jgi:hypothetical protein
LTVFIAIFFGCANDATGPKLRCTQPDFTVNKMVAEIRTNAGAIVTQYTYDDIIEAYVVSVMKTVIFLKLFLYRL